VPCAWRARLCDFLEVRCSACGSAATWLDRPQPRDERCSLDHLVRRGQKRFRDGEAEGFGGLIKVDGQLILGRRLYWQVRRLLPLEDAMDITGCAPIRLNRI
jgi:hypothetical protein